MDWRDREGEAAREEAREEATIAFASESTVLTECVEVDVKRRFGFCRLARQEGL